MDIQNDNVEVIKENIKKIEGQIRNLEWQIATLKRQLFYLDDFRYNINCGKKTQSLFESKMEQLEISKESTSDYIDTEWLNLKEYKKNNYSVEDLARLKEVIKRNQGLD